jgi:hypothetical protein
MSFVAHNDTSQVLVIPETLMADDDIREGDPDRPRKKKPRPADDDEDDRPRKKRPSADDEVDEEERPKKKKIVRHDEDEEEERPKKKKKIARREEEDDEDDDLGSSALSAVLPVGGSVFALMSLWLSIISFALAVVALGSYFEIITLLPRIPAILACTMPSFWPFAILSGGLSFFTGKRKLSYGSISGNMRAIFGILLALVVMVMQIVIIYLHAKK